MGAIQDAIEKVVQDTSHGNCYPIWSCRNWKLRV